MVIVTCKIRFPGTGLGMVAIHRVVAEALAVEVRVVEGLAVGALVVEEDAEVAEVVKRLRDRKD